MLNNPISSRSTLGNDNSVNNWGFKDTFSCILGVIIFLTQEFSDTAISTKEIQHVT